MKTLAILVIALLIGAAADARNTDHVLAIQDAVQGELGRERLLQVLFYFAGQEHPAAEAKISTVRSNRHTSGVFRSDERACEIAFLSALIQLQTRAQRENADAIIDIISVTRNRNLISATEYRCVAGATVVHVGLEGTLVRLQKSP